MSPTSSTEIAANNPKLRPGKKSPSLNVPFNQAPNMSARQVTTQAIAAIKSEAYDHIRLNLANGDMVGHTGDLDATISAVECVDESVGQLMDAVREVNGILLVTADHGNADQMFGIDKKDGQLHNQPTHQPLSKRSPFLGLRAPFLNQSQRRNGANCHGRNCTNRR